MNLGTQTGSLINHLYSRGVIGQPQATVGMGATILGFTDRHPATVVEVFSIGKATAIKVQYDDARRLDKNGISESQEYEFTPNPNAGVRVFKQESSGAWSSVYMNHETKRWNKSDSMGLRLGERDKYHDFTF